MSEPCGCGSRITAPEQQRRCARCEACCCVACAFSLEAGTFCRGCAEAVLESGGTPLRFPWVAGAAPGRDAPAHAPDARLPQVPESPGPPPPWIIVVAREQTDLYDHLIRAFARDDKVEVVLDRRRDVDRNPPAVVERLQTLGAALVRRPAVSP